MKRFRIRWWTIRIPTIYIYFSAGAVVLVTALLMVMIFGGKYSISRNQKTAAQKIVTAKELYTKAESDKVTRHELASIQTLIQKAEAFLLSTEYRAAISVADDAIQQLEYAMAAQRLNPDEPEGRFAKITEVHGLVEILPPNSVDWIAAGKGQVIRNGTRVRTQSQSTAKLKFDDDSTIQMKANSLIMIRELNEDENTQSLSSSIELGKSDIEANIKEPGQSGSNFILTMPDNSQASIQTEANLAVSVDEKNMSIVKVFLGRVEVMSGERSVSLSTREALIIDPKKNKNESSLQTVAIPVAPRLIYPANVQLLSISSRNPEPLNFRWTMAQEAEKYRLEIAKDYYFYENTFNAELSENKAKVEKLESGNYYWRVTSIDKSGLTSEPSLFNSFRIVYDDDLQSQQKDLIPPKIQIDNISIMGHIVDISGKTEPTAGLFVNEKKEDVFDDGSFRVLIEFDKPGFHIIFIEAYDSAGNVATARREVTISDSSVK